MLAPWRSKRSKLLGVTSRFLSFVTRQPWLSFSFSFSSFLLLLFFSIAHDKCVSGKRLDMTPGNPPFQKTVNSSSAKASLAQDFVSQKRSLTDCALMGMTSPPCPPCPLHPSFMSLGAFAPPTGRQPGLHCGVAGAVVGEAGWRFLPRAFHLPSLPCRGWSRAAG